MNLRILVLLYFVPEDLNEEVDSEMRLLCRELVRHRCGLLVPDDWTGAPNSGKVCVIRQTQRLTELLPELCLFVTPPLSREDTLMAKRIDEARGLGIRRHGFIFKTSQKLVPFPTFALFANRDTEVSNAIYSHKDILHWAIDHLPSV